MNFGIFILTHIRAEVKSVSTCDRWAFFCHNVISWHVDKENWKPGLRATLLKIFLPFICLWNSLRPTRSTWSRLKSSYTRHINSFKFFVSCLSLPYIQNCPKARYFVAFNAHFVKYSKTNKTAKGCVTDQVEGADKSPAGEAADCANCSVGDAAPSVSCGVHYRRARFCSVLAKAPRNTIWLERASIGLSYA